MTKTYARPLGLVTGRSAGRLLARGEAWPLAGGPLAFTHVALHQRGQEAEVVPVADWQPDEALKARLTQPRAPIASFDWRAPVVMGILNVTPDSFSDGGAHNEAAAAVARAEAMRTEGADIIDVGGESTRPGSDLVGEDEELARVSPVLQALQGKALLSIDTRKAGVMRAAVQAGAAILNDVSALTFDEDAPGVAASLGLPVILMHAQGDPKTMQDAPHYEDVLLDVYDYLEARIEAAMSAGVAREKIIVDPGIGFGKTLDHNLALLGGLSLFHGLGCPILLGASRKRFIAMASKGEGEDARLGGSLAAVLQGAAQGVQMFRVHDVAETAQALRIFRPVS
ncbi:MAG: dihydropteroate synthase [Alphaproteobacteria bacterium]|nr:MAG: dihydropteroate synthase [Alphaproteobacteria bacterium]